MSSTQDLTDTLLRAAIFAGRAPSLHNSQPWHWQIGAGVLDLRLEPRRVLAVSDPNARLAVLSCGAALHHARIHLAVEGWRVAIARVPDSDDPDLLARLRVGDVEPGDGDPVPPDGGDLGRLVRAALRRRTNRRGTPGVPVDRHRVASIRAAVRAQGADLTLLRPHQVVALAGAAERAYDVEAADPAWQVEVAGWVGGDRPLGTGIPASALPSDPELLTAPARVLRRAGAALVAETHRHAAVFAVLHTPGDDRRDWLTAGEGLSAGWLTATELDVAVLPLSVVTEVTSSRDRIRHLLGWSGYPHLLLRLASGATDDIAPATPRLAAKDVISIV